MQPAVTSHTHTKDSVHHDVYKYTIVFDLDLVYRQIILFIIMMNKTSGGSITVGIQSMKEIILIHQHTTNIIIINSLNT